MSEMVVRTPEIIAIEINSIKEQTKNIVLHNSIEIGRKLVEAKSLLPHGEWGKWLEKSVSYSQRTANDLMRIFNEYGSSQITFLGDNLNSQTYANLSYSNALALLGLPSDTREKFVEDNNVEDMSARELKRAIEELKRADKEKEKALKERDKALEQISSLEETNRILEDTFNEGAEERNLLVEKIAELEKELEDVKSRKVESEDIDYIETMEEVQAKIDKILEEKEELERKLKATEDKQNDSSVKFKIYFKQELEIFQKLFEELENVKQQDEEEYLKLKNGLEKFLNSMLDRLV
ncbi:DUF3102 domain-containing protein [Clostridium sp. NSJ-49]|uniref:DUF3102 domain-containing protein n=1 Tax=Clostridium sp. NSJ-49 TaxID=2763034 RepID=UPI00164AEDB8|nr:DUF3102 domain-containing protein [Clostridium sp. NSJ-49]MBC5624983.1 DUF3102 domain-containing protein [Clostridium sp. NSJ-49]